MSQTTRLDKVEASLTPKQAVIRWLKEIEQYPGIVELAEHVRSLPESAAPVTRLTRQVGEAVRSDMKGARPELVEAAVRKANRDVVFLVKLHHQANAKVYTEQRAWRLTVRLIAAMQHRLLTKYELRNALSQRKGKSSPAPGLTKRDRESVRNCEEEIKDFLTELYAIQGAIASICDRYFDGHQVLLHDADQFLTQEIEITERLAGLWNDSCADKSIPGKEIDLEKVRRLAEKGVSEETAPLVSMAKSDALDSIGDYRGAREEASRLALRRATSNA